MMEAVFRYETDFDGVEENADRPAHLTLHPANHLARAISAKSKTLAFTAKNASRGIQDALLVIDQGFLHGAHAVVVPNRFTSLHLSLVDAWNSDDIVTLENGNTAFIVHLDNSVLFLEIAGNRLIIHRYNASSLVVGNIQVFDIIVEDDPEEIAVERSWPTEHELEAYRDYFWENVNSTIDNYFIQPGDTISEEECLSFDDDGQEQLQHITEQLVQIWLAQESSVASEQRSATIQFDSGAIDGVESYFNEAGSTLGDTCPAELANALNRAAASHKFRGYSRSYNDGDQDRSSGYGTSDENFIVEVSVPVSGHERIRLIKASRPAVTAWLYKHGFDDGAVEKIVGTAPDETNQ